MGEATLYRYLYIFESGYPIKNGIYGHGKACIAIIMLSVYSGWWLLAPGKRIYSQKTALGDTEKYRAMKAHIKPYLVGRKFYADRSSMYYSFGYLYAKDRHSLKKIRNKNAKGVFLYTKKWSDKASKVKKEDFKDLELLGEYFNYYYFYLRE